jgi:hypothetical protein
MPCRDHYTDNNVRYVENPVNRELKERLDQVTKLLCFVMNNSDSAWLQGVEFRYGMERDPFDPVEIELMEWWAEHERLDAAARDNEERLKHLQENAKQLRAMRILAKLNEEFSEEEIEELKDLI